MSTNADRITTISLDGNGTLWDFEQVARSSLGRTITDLRRLIPAAEALTVETMTNIRRETVRDLRGTGLSLDQMRLESFKRTLQYIGHPDDELADHLNALYLRHRFEDVQLFDDVLPTLDGLRGRFKLGLLSNDSGYPRQCGLDTRLQFVVLSQDYGIEKPDPGIFKIALEQAGCTERELLHIGDSLVNDVSGAKRAGVRSVWLNRRRATNDTEFRPDFEIASLMELIEICEKVAR